MENLNNLAADITKREGKKQEVTIAQVKEIIAIMGERWREMGAAEMLREVAAIYERAGLKESGEEINEN